MPTPPSIRPPEFRGSEDIYVPHVGWLQYPAGDYVGESLREGWYDYREQAFLWRYLRDGDIFVDGGSHAGLYSRVALAVSSPSGRIIAVEPGTAACSYLRANVYGMEDRASVVRAALADHTGSATFFEGSSEASAYSSLTDPQYGSANAVQVELETIDTLFTRHSVSRIDCLKMDVEGAEVAALAGAVGALRTRAIQVILMEVTELNLRRFDASTAILLQTARAAGYLPYRWDSDSKLIPFEESGPVWYENLLFTSDAAAVEARLSDASTEHTRISNEILRRGSACEAARSGELRHNRDLAEGRAKHYEQQLREADRMAAEANNRADTALTQVEEAYKHVGELRWQLDEAIKRTDAANARAITAWKEAAENDARAAEALQRASAACAQLDEAYKRVGELQWRVDAAAKQLDVANASAAAADLRAADASDRADRAVQSTSEALRERDQALAALKRAEDNVCELLQSAAIRRYVHSYLRLVNPGLVSRIAPWMPSKQ